MHASCRPIGLIVALALVLAPGAMASDWEWAVTPYVWASDVSMDIKEDGQQSGDITLAFSDLIKKVDMAAQVHFEGRRGRGGFLVDVTYISLSDEATISGNPEVPDGTVLAVDLDLTILEAGGFFSLGKAASGLDLIFGVRSIDMDQGIVLSLPVPELLPLSEVRVDAGDTFTDGFVGLRFAGALSNSWAIQLRADYATGDTDQTWNGIAALGFVFGGRDQYSVRFGYRHMEIQIDDTVEGVRVQTDLTMSGPIVGFTFGWGGS